MKHLILTLFILLTSTLIIAQTTERETVYSLVKQKRTIEWYKQQANLWSTYLKKEETNAEGWLNYYMANRMLKLYKSGVTPKQLDSIVEVISKKIPNTFEYHYIAYYNSGFKDIEENEKHLKKAQELGPNRVELMDDLMSYYQVRRDKENIKNIAHKWYQSNDISPGIYAWCYNMLQSVEDNAILITVGDNDTYPSWVLQEVHKVKPNVSIINNSLISMKNYREIYFKELGIPMFHPDTSKLKTWVEIQQALILHIKNNTTRPLYFTISAQKHLYEMFDSNIYNVGLAFKYCENKFDNIAVMKKNYEKHFLLDYLKYNLSNDISQGVIDASNSNYLLCFITLYHHYVASEENQKAQEIKSRILQIAECSGQTEEIKKLLSL